MMLVEETSVPEAALPVTEFKAHLRLGSGFGDESLQDDVLDSFLRAALSAVEARTGKILIARNFAWEVSAWRDPAALQLPVAPVDVVTAVELSDQQGGVVTVASSAYRLVQDMHLPSLRGTGSALPTIPQNGAATVRFGAGFGVNWSDVPADLQHAVLLLAAHYYEYRHDTGLQRGCMPFGVTSLLERYRVMRLGIGVGLGAEQ